MGARDRDLPRKTNVQSLDDTVIHYNDSDLLSNDIEGLTKKVLQQLHGNAQRVWLHIDLDVLSTESLPAVDYQQPVGLSWEQLEALGKTAMSHGAIAGCDITIYNPGMDPDGQFAQRIVRFLGSLIA